MKPKGWRDLAIGAIIPEGGTSKAYKTGDWRSDRPVWHEDKCIHCLICVMYCPDDAIIVKDNKVVGIDYDYCKGCGICANECPRKAIDMRPEKEFMEI